MEAKKVSWHVYPLNLPASDSGQILFVGVSREHREAVFDSNDSYRGGQ